MSIFGAILLSTACVTIKPLAKYPDLFTVLVSVYSCGHFVLFLIWFHYLQFSTPWSSEVKVQPKRVSGHTGVRKGKGKKKSHKVE